VCGQGPWWGAFVRGVVVWGQKQLGAPQGDPGLCLQSAVHPCVHCLLLAPLPVGRRQRVCISFFSLTVYILHLYA
jgi:hypothetical protein